MRFDDPTIGLPPKDEGAERAPTSADMVRARLLNLFGLVSPASNVAMVFWSPKEIRWIGIGAGVLFALAIPAYATFTDSPDLMWASVGCHYGLVLLGLIHPKLPEYPAKWWIAFGKGLGKFMSVPIFALLYFLAVTPTAVIVRLFGHDPLRNDDAGADTYWRDHEPQPKERFERQF